MKKLLLIAMLVSTSAYSQKDIETREFLSEKPVDFEGDVFFEDKIKFGDNGDQSRMIKKTVNNKTDFRRGFRYAMIAFSVVNAGSIIYNQMKMEDHYKDYNKVDNRDEADFYYTNARVSQAYRDWSTVMLGLGLTGITLTWTF